MRKVIDIRSMHTAIHSLFLVNKNHDLMIRTFRDLAEEPLDDFQKFYAWEIISENCENLGEINFRDISGGQATSKGIPLDDCIYADSDNEYQVIARFDLYDF